MQENTTTQPINTFVQINSQTEKTVSLDTSIGLSIIMIPVIVCFGFNAYKRYRAAVLRQEIASLEKLWHLDIKNKNF